MPLQNNQSKIQIKYMSSHVPQNKRTLILILHVKSSGIHIIYIKTTNKIKFSPYRQMQQQQRRKDYPK